MSTSDKNECGDTAADHKTDALCTVQTPVSDSEALESNLKYQQNIDGSGDHLPSKKTENDTPKDSGDTSLLKDKKYDKTNDIPLETQKGLTPIVLKPIPNIIEELKAVERSSEGSKSDWSENDEICLRWDDDEEPENYGHGTEGNTTEIIAPEKDVLEELDAQITELSRKDNINECNEFVDEVMNKKSNEDENSAKNILNNEELCSSAAKSDGIDISSDLVELKDNINNDQEITEIEPSDITNNDIIKVQDNEMLDIPSEDNSLLQNDIVQNIPIVKEHDLQEETEKDIVLEKEDNSVNCSEQTNKTFEGEISLIEPIEHNLNQTNVMIEIPTQELINISDDLMDTTEEDALLASGSPVKLSTGTMDYDNTDSNEKPIETMDVKKTDSVFNIDNNIVTNMDVDTDNDKSICDSEPINKITPSEKVITSEDNEDIMEINAEVVSNTDSSLKTIEMEVDCVKSDEMVISSSECLTSDQNVKIMEQEVTIKDQSDRNLEEIGIEPNLKEKESEVETIKTPVTISIAKTEKQNDISDETDQNPNQNINVTDINQEVTIKNQKDHNLQEIGIKSNLKENDSEVEAIKTPVETAKIEKQYEISGETDLKPDQNIKSYLRNLNDNNVETIPQAEGDQTNDNPSQTEMEVDIKEVSEAIEDFEPMKRDASVAETQLASKLNKLEEIASVLNKEDSSTDNTVTEIPQTDNSHVKEVKTVDEIEKSTTEQVTKDIIKASTSNDELHSDKFETKLEELKEINNKETEPASENISSVVNKEHSSTDNTVTEIPKTDNSNVEEMKTVDEIVKPTTEQVTKDIIKASTSNDALHSDKVETKLEELKEINNKETQLASELNELENISSVVSKEYSSTDNTVTEIPTTDNSHVQEIKTVDEIEKSTTEQVTQDIIEASTSNDELQSDKVDTKLKEINNKETQLASELNELENISSVVNKEDSIDNTVTEIPKTDHVEEIKTVDEVEKSATEQITEDTIEPSTSNDALQSDKVDTKLEKLKEIDKKVDVKDDNTSKTMPLDVVVPSTSRIQVRTDLCIETVTKMDDAVPSTSKIQVRTDLCAQTAREMAEDETASDMTDSLGLLAESSRVRDDDDEPEPESERDDDDDDFDQYDESSNQMVDQSEDSAQHSGSDAPRGPLDKDVDDSGPSAQTSPDALPGEGFNFEIEEVDEKELVLEDDSVCSEVEMTATDDIPDVEMGDETSNLSLEPQSDSNAVGDDGSVLRSILVATPTVDKKPDEETKQSPSKLKKLEISKPKHVVSIVDLEESSSEDDTPQTSKQTDQQEIIFNIDTTDNLSDLKDKIADTEDTDSKEKHALVETGETAKSTSEAKSDSKQDNGDKSTKGNLEVFNLDSEDEDTVSATSIPQEEKAPEPEKEIEKEKLQPQNRCANNLCSCDSKLVCLQADAVVRAYYDSQRRSVCERCAQDVANRTRNLLEGIKNFTPLLEMDMSRPGQHLVEILDSESDEEGDTTEKDGEKIGLEIAKDLEGKLASMFNETWLKYDLDKRLKETEDKILVDMDALELESSEVNAMLDECQLATDRLRAALYAAFEPEKVQIAPLVIVDTPESMFSYVEPTGTKIQGPKKRRSSTESVGPAKKHVASPAPSTNADKTDTDPVKDIDSKMDDDKDISVVTLSAEAAPAELPPPGELVREPLRVGMQVYAMRNMYGSWTRAKIVERVSNPTPSSPFTMCRVKFELRGGKSVHKVLPARCLAYQAAPPHRLTIGTRVIALFKDNTDKMVKRESYYSGVVAEIPNPVNKYRYLVFFDDGYAQYVQHADTRLVCEFCSLVWEEVHPFSRDFVREYLLAYPERPMVRLHQGQSLKTEWNGKWWISRVIEVDASLVHVYFEHDKRTEWIYRGSTRLAPLYLERQNAGKIRTRPLPRNRMQTGTNMPYVEYTRTDEQETKKDATEVDVKTQQEELRRQRAVAKKSTTQPQQSSTTPPVQGSMDSVTSRVVYYTPKNAIRPQAMVPHQCTPHCKRTDVLALTDLRTYNPLAKPLLSGWERQIVRFKGMKEVMYRAPCGRRIRNMAELHRYLQLVKSDMAVDLFHFGPNIHCLAEFVLNKCIVGKKDLSHGKENVPVPCVNYYDGSLPEFCSYNTERTPTAGVPLNLDPDFLCGCDCTDDCQDKSKCACWKMTLEGARTIGLEGDNVGYEYKRLTEPLPSGIYECNVRCKCKSTCLNRVAQHPLQLKLQVFKTLNRGWGIRALNDVPKGSFLCVYAGNLLTDATANLDGLNEGDEYLAELDYIEVVEQMKEGFEDDIPEQDKKLDKQESRQSESSSSQSESDNEQTSRTEQEDGDFEPGYIPGHVTEFSKRLRKRNKDKKEKKEAKREKERAEREKCDKDGNKEDDEFITISDDEELREPARFAAQAGMAAKFVSKYKSVRSYFGKDEACYIMDAKVQGNIGRYLNHSCSPNVFVQNVFVDTHDPRFPWVAFFALSHIRAGTELTWNYNYDVGSVPNKALYCYCGAHNCRGRLL